MIAAKYLEYVIYNSTWWNYASELLDETDQNNIIHRIVETLLSYIENGDPNLILEFEANLTFFGSEARCGYFCDVLAEDFFRESIDSFCGSDKTNNENFHNLLASSVLYVSHLKSSKDQKKNKISEIE